MVNWLSFVKDYREKHPEVSYKEALTICSPLYKKNMSATEEVVERPESKPEIKRKVNRLWRSPSEKHVPKRNPKMWRLRSKFNQKV